MREWKKPIFNELSVELTTCIPKPSGGKKWGITGYACPRPKNSCWKRIRNGRKCPNGCSGLPVYGWI